MSIKDEKWRRCLLHLFNNSLTLSGVMKASGKELDHQEMLSKVAVMRTRRQRRKVQDTARMYLMLSTWLTSWYRTNTQTHITVLATSTVNVATNFTNIFGKIIRLSTLHQSKYFIDCLFISHFGFDCQTSFFKCSKISHISI